MKNPTQASSPFSSARSSSSPCLFHYSFTSEDAATMIPVYRRRFDLNASLRPADAGYLVSLGEQELVDHQHPSPWIKNTQRGGSKWERNSPLPIEVGSEQNRRDSSFWICHLLSFCYFVCLFFSLAQHWLAHCHNHSPLARQHSLLSFLSFPGV
jgi:hypothetical protein